MKNIAIYFILLSLAVILSSCGVNTAVVANINQNATQVHLTSNNFTVVDQISGSSEVAYVLAIGGMNKRQLYENAYSAMMKKANLLSSSKAIINVMTEEQVSGFAPFYVRRTVTVSAQVIEFNR